MSNDAMTGSKVLVLGASRGLGRGIAEAAAEAGATVVAVGRRAPTLEGVEGRGADVTDPTQLGRLLDAIEPDAVILTAGASPLMRPLAHYDWQALSANWNTDVKATFHLLQATLHRTLPAKARVVVFSSGAALNAGGSPLSGGYAGAKQTQRFLCCYAANEAREREIPVTIHCVVPQLNPNTDLGRAAVTAYAKKAGVAPEDFVQKRFGDRPLSPSIAGEAVVGLLAGAHDAAPELLLSGKGLAPLG